MKITKQITIQAPPERIFDALTSSELIPQYFPLNKVESDWQVGSEVLYHGEIDGETFTDYGLIEAFNRPQLYSYRYWSDNHGTERTADNHLTISYQLTAKDNHTELTVEQDNIQTKQMYELMNNQVWDYLLDSLKKYIEK